MIKELVKNCLKILPLKNVIIFESCPDLSDNTMPVFNELVRRGYNKKYKLIWACMDDYGCRKIIENVSYINRNRQKLRFLLLNSSAKATICCNRFTGSRKKGQHNFYLCHGTPLKDVSQYYNAPKFINHIIASSEYMKPILANQLQVNEEIIEPLGFPRNDILINKAADLKSLFGNFEKFVVWYPTVKKFKNGKTTGCVKPVQFIWNDVYAKMINDTLVKNHTLLIIKPHFAQIPEDHKKINFTNIRFIDDRFFADNGITSYQMVGGCDALLTDYSSIYSDFLLCDKPIGLLWEDIEEYSKDPGLIKEYEFICSGGVKIYTCTELCDFLNDIYIGNDHLKEQRKNILPYIHCSELPDNTERVTDYIIKIIDEAN